MTYKTHWFH